MGSSWKGLEDSLLSPHLRTGFPRLILITDTFGQLGKHHCWTDETRAVADLFSQP